MVNNSGSSFMKIIIFSLLMFYSVCSNAEYLAEWSQSEFLEKRNQENVIVVDVRSSREFESGHIMGAINIPYDEIKNNFHQLEIKQTIVLYCQSGRRAGIAEKWLTENGYTNVIHLKGDFGDWRAKSLPIQH